MLNGSQPVQDFLTLISCISSNFHNDVIFTIAFAWQIIQYIEIMSGIVCYFKNLNNKHHEQWLLQMLKRLTGKHFLKYVANFVTLWQKTNKVQSVFTHL